MRCGAVVKKKEDEVEIGLVVTAQLILCNVNADDNESSPVVWFLAKPNHNCAVVKNSTPSDSYTLEPKCSHGCPPLHCRCLPCPVAYYQSARKH